MRYIIGHLPDPVGLRAPQFSCPEVHNLDLPRLKRVHPAAIFTGYRDERLDATVSALRWKSRTFYTKYVGAAGCAHSLRNTIFVLGIRTLAPLCLDVGDAALWFQAFSLTF